MEARAHVEGHDAQLEQRAILVDQPGGLPVHGLAGDQLHAAKEPAVVRPRQVRKRALPPQQLPGGPARPR